jgi:hypothetical protein
MAMQIQALIGLGLGTTDIDAKATRRERRTKRRGAKKTTDPKEGPMW